MNEITYADFEKVAMHVGTIVDAKHFPEARKPAYKLVIDFGPLGTRKSSAQITDRYKLDELLGKQVIAVTNFPRKQIGTFMSECLVLGVLGDSGVILLQPDQQARNGDRVL